MHVAIPSKGRAGRSRSVKLIPSATVYVPEIEVEAYKRVGIEHVVGVPGDIRGITKTRNWILRNVSDPWVVFVDDDVKTAGWIKLYSHNAKNNSLTEARWLQEWRRLFEVTEGMKYRIWGISTDGATRSNYPYKPFLFHTYVTASCMGIINDGRTYFDETFQVKEDYELCLRCIKEDGGVVGARYFFWVNDHWTGEGGCKDYRTQSMEEDCTRRLIRMYPGLIRRVTRGGSEYSIDLNF